MEIELFDYFKQHVGNFLGKGLEAQQYHGKSFSVGVKLSRSWKNSLSIW